MRRRRWTAEEKAQILTESFEPGASVADVARRHGVNRGLLWTWRHEARKRGAIGEQPFVPLRIAEEPAAPAAPMRSAPAGSEAGAGPAGSGKQEDTKEGWALGSIDIELGGAHVRVNGVVDAAVLRQVLSYLGRRS